MITILAVASLHKKSPADLVTFTEEILNGKLHFLCTIWYMLWLPFLNISQPFEILLAFLDKTNKTTDTKSRHENKTEHNDNSNDILKDDANTLGEDSDKTIELHSDINKTDGQSDTKEKKDKNMSVLREDKTSSPEVTGIGNKTSEGTKRNTPSKEKTSRNNMETPNESADNTHDKITEYTKDLQDVNNDNDTQYGKAKIPNSSIEENPR